MRLLYKIQLGKDNQTDALIDYNRELYKMLYEVISRGINQHAFQSSMPTEEIVKHFVIAYRGLVFEWCIHHPDFDLKEKALCHFKIMLTGIGSPSKL